MIIHWYNKYQSIDNNKAHTWSKSYDSLFLDSSPSCQYARIQASMYAKIRNVHGLKSHSLRQNITKWMENAIFSIDLHDKFGQCAFPSHSRQIFHPNSYSSRYSSLSMSTPPPPCKRCCVIVSVEFMQFLQQHKSVQDKPDLRQEHSIPSQRVFRHLQLIISRILSGVFGASSSIWWRGDRLIMSINDHQGTGDWSFVAVSAEKLQLGMRPASCAELKHPSLEACFVRMGRTSQDRRLCISRHWLRWM